MKRTKHNLTHYRLLTGDMGKLYPIGLIEALPGDTFEHSTSMMVRLSPMAAPVMHAMTVRVHHFFVPHRLTWDGFEDFITGGPDGNDATTVPTISSTGATKDILDYFGIPRVSGVSISALPVRAYNAIFNEFYRDQDLVTERLESDVTVANIAWEKDYFTSARPWAQKGDAVTIPLGTSAPITGIGMTNQTYNATPVNVYETDGSGTVSYSKKKLSDTTVAFEEDPNNPGFPNIRADLSAAQAVTINTFRRAFAMQRIAEARARYGSRYVEYLRYLGVTPADGRLDRPEYLGGGRIRVNVSEVLQTAPETGTTPTNALGVGDMYGHGIAAMRSNAYRRYIEEHGYIVSLLSVRPKACYLSGIPRTWLRQDREDFFQKELQHIGQQEVLKSEIFADATTGRETFGYQDRYRDYREEHSRVAGEFRDTLDYWHLGRDLASMPSLNASFVECAPSKRIFNVQTNDILWCMAQHRIAARRLVERGGVSRII